MSDPNTLKLTPGSRLRTAGVTYEVTGESHVPAGMVEVVPQPTRLLKVLCEACGYTARVTKRWIDKSGAPICPCGHGAMLVVIKVDATPAAKPAKAPKARAIHSADAVAAAAAWTEAIKAAPKVGTIDGTYAGTGASFCSAKNPGGFECTRAPHHTGEHIAHGSDAKVCVAPWPQVATPIPIVIDEALITEAVDAALNPASELAQLLAGL